MTWLIPTDQLPAPGRALARKLWDPRQPLAEPPTPEHLAAHPIGQTIRAATDYMDLIDQDWLRIADWYRPGTTPQHRLDHRELWQEGEGSLMIAQLQRTNIKTPSQYTFKECPSSFISSCVTLTQITQRRAGNYARAQRYRHRRLSYVTSRQIFLLRRKESLYLVSSSSHGAS